MRFWGGKNSVWLKNLWVIPYIGYKNGERSGGDIVRHGSWAARSAASSKPNEYYGNDGPPHRDRPPRSGLWGLEIRTVCACAWSTFNTIVATQKITQHIYVKVKHFIIHLPLRNLQHVISFVYRQLYVCQLIKEIYIMCTLYFNFVTDVTRLCLVHTSPCWWPWPAWSWRPWGPDVPCAAG